MFSFFSNNSAIQQTNAAANVGTILSFNSQENEALSQQSLNSIAHQFGIV